jgi:cytidylate kinase
VAEDVSSEEVRALIGEAISETAARGQVVIVGHAASHALAPSADRLRVLVTASPATRAKRAGDDEPADLARAGKLVTASDAGRADYLKRFYGINRELPTHYDLVVNTDALSLEAAAVLISQAASGLDVPPRPGRAAPER